jgi:CheY-like chemotaxis protein
MQKTILDVGNCGPDHAAIKRMFATRFNARVVQADSAADALPLLRRESIDLVVVNRKLDCDYSDGMDVVRQIKADPQLQSLPVMLVTNYPEHQEAAVALGAEYGFGKLQLDSPQTLCRLSRVLGQAPVGSS